MKYLLSMAALALSLNIFAQAPGPVCGDPSVITYHDPVFCTSTCTTLHALVSGQTATSAGLTIDDVFSSVIPLGFTFYFYGVPYTQCVIGANGMISFDLSHAGTYNEWEIIGPLLGNTDALNSICGPWCDMDPYIPGGAITISTTGTAPNRRFVATWCHEPMYDAISCPGQWTTTQIILYEGCNYIDVHVGHKTICTAWNPDTPPGTGGRAIIGVQNAAGTSATTPPGRDFPSIYNCTKEAWRFTFPGTAYTVASIPYNPVPNTSSAVNWYTGASGGSFVGTGTTLPCVDLGTPRDGAIYRAEVLGCDSVISTSVIHVFPAGKVSTGRITVCNGSSTPLPSLPGGGTWSGGPAAIATLNPVPSPGTVTGIVPGLATYTYTYGDDGCTYILSIEVAACGCVDTCFWTLSGNAIHSGKNIFGTTSNDKIRIISNNTDRAVIQAGGNMGIKQLTPTTTFDVDCIPVTAPSGLRFEHLPFGNGSNLVVDPLGYVYVVPPSTLRPVSNTELQEQVNQLKQQLDEMNTRLNQFGAMPVDINAGNSLSATPNPTNGQMNASYTIAGAFNSAVINITDMQGRIIISRTVNNNTGNVIINLPASMVSGDIIVGLVVDGKLVAKQKEALVK